MNWKSRKNIIAGIIFVVVTVLVYTTKNDIPSNYANLIENLYWAVIAGNVGSKFANKGKDVK